MVTFPNNIILIEGSLLQFTEYQIFLVAIIAVDLQSCFRFATFGSRHCVGPETMMLLQLQPSSKSLPISRTTTFDTANASKARNAAITMFMAAVFAMSFFNSVHFVSVPSSSYARQCRTIARHHGPCGVELQSTRDTREHEQILKHMSARPYVAMLTCRAAVEKGSNTLMASHERRNNPVAHATKLHVVVATTLPDENAVETLPVM